VIGVPSRARRAAAWFMTAKIGVFHDEFSRPEAPVSAPIGDSQHPALVLALAFALVVPGLAEA